MSEIDWDKAPEWATHWCPGNARIKAGWIYRAGNEFYACYADKGLEHIVDFPAWRFTRLIPRPSPAWSGEGLPPVGVACKIIGGDSKWWSYSGFESGEIVTVRHSFKNSKGYDVVVVEGCDGGCLAVTVDCVEVIRTTEQIEADEREKMANMLWQRYLQPILAPAKEAQVKAALGLIYDDFYRKP